MPRTTTPRVREAARNAAAPAFEPEVALGALAPPVDPAALFGPGAAGDPAAGDPGTAVPIEVEVGFGKGRYLLAQARARGVRGARARLIGIERSAPYLRLLRRRLLLGGLDNVRLVRADALDVLGRLLRPGSIDAVAVLFPDPWPKRRHNKRRLVSGAFGAACARALRPGGTLSVATDHHAYWSAIAAALDAVAELEPLALFQLDPDLALHSHFAGKLGPRGAVFHCRSWRRRG